jgi:RimJ/RimL family protein N-acetyltransferase
VTDQGFDFAVGPEVPGWTARPVPPRRALEGRFARVEPLDLKRHGADLWRAFAADRDGSGWTYFTYGPFADEAAFGAWLERVAASNDPLFHAVIDARSGAALGMASYLRIDPASGVIEVGHIHFSPALQRSAIATDAMYLMMARVFDELGYRRYEWKCNDLNLPSRAAARRLGFTFEGVFRQALVVKGRNRDTAWFSILDSEWPARKAAFLRWLEPGNFDAAGRQRQSLAALSGA